MIKPLYDRILVKREEAQEKSAGGIIFPISETPMDRGVIVALGEGRLLNSGVIRKPTVKIGDKVFFSEHVGVEVDSDGEKLLMMNEDDLLGVFDASL